LLTAYPEKNKIPLLKKRIRDPSLIAPSNPQSDALNLYLSCAILGWKIMENGGILLNLELAQVVDFLRKSWHASKNRFRTHLKRAYESNTLEKLRDFLSMEPQLVTG
jgi:hypothetical protein